LPDLRAPYLGAVANADKLAITVEMGIIPQFLRYYNSPLLIAGHLGGAGEERTQKGPCLRVIERQTPKSLLDVLPFFHGVDEDAGIESGGGDKYLAQLLTEAGRHKQAPFIIEGVGIVSQEHGHLPPSSTLLHLTPLVPTYFYQLIQSPAKSQKKIAGADAPPLLREKID
jgi:hypothetical protein